MKIGVAGKGGAGKTTVSGTLARAFARAGHRVIAVDADVNPMLGISLGLGMDVTERLATVRQSLDHAGGDEHGEHVATVEAMLERFGADAPDGVRVIIASRTERPDSGCGCCGVTTHRLLGELDSTDRIVLGDLEAGTGVLARMQAGSLDVVLVVANPTPKSIEVARRAVETAVARHSRVIIIANRVRDDADLEAIEAVLGRQVTVVIPEDPVISAADAEGVAPIDLDDHAPGVLALVELSERLAFMEARAG